MGRNPWIFATTTPATLLVRSAQIGGFFLFQMKFEKPALSPMQHVRVWRDRGLQVEDEAEAVHYLTYIGYYRLSGYARPLTRQGT